MAETTYPLGMYKDHGPDVENECRYAHTLKEQQALAEAGFTDDKRNLPPNDFPRLLYNAKGEYVRVISRVEEDAAKELGYGRKYVAKKETPAAKANGSAADNGRIDQLENEMAEMKETMAQILEAITNKKGK